MTVLACVPASGEFDKAKMAFEAQDAVLAGVKIDTPVEMEAASWWCHWIHTPEGENILAKSTPAAVAIAFAVSFENWSRTHK